MSVRDVAEFILRSRGEMTAMKLQKLVYYSQAWSLVWDERPMFAEPIQAWANGPVCRSLYSAHHKQFSVAAGNIIPPDAQPKLDEKAIGTINAVLNFYGDKSAQWLSDLTHMEAPWILARKRAGVKEGEPSEEEILLSDMHEYYSGIQAANTTQQ
ncbi:Panacea domain-containing protein [Agrobacterium sp. ST15.13.015]|uniref:Panacea domain-containing protein n=1 Tax=Agrobacterium sp. ST15.13.015 TaxID=3017319 RepID=UPI0022CBB5AA|nr:type II toxin-antitoxin system antitoxin SocA domain-containing protein [Agrobacterium sp. ST15.13.015]MCZ7498869.1 DUF4065 domain-containing protein [Rhizobium rhizogenes]